MCGSIAWSKLDCSGSCFSGSYHGGINIYKTFAIKYVNNKAEKTNVESMAGKQGIVIAEIDNINAKGMIKVDGMEWTARSVDGDIIPKDSLVTVVSVEGVKAMVRKAE